MNEYTVFSNKFDMTKLMNNINKEMQIDRFKDEGTTKYIVKIKDNNDFNKFLGYMSVFLSVNKFAGEFYLELKKKFNDASKIKKIIKNHFEYTYENTYFKTLTQINLAEYLKYNETLNVDAFMMFNMHGIKEEANYMAGMELECDGNYVGSRDAFDYDDDEDDDEEIEGIEDGNEFLKIFVFLKKAYDSLSDPPKIKDIHVRFKNKKLVFESNNNENINLNYLDEKLNVKLSFVGSENTPDYINDILLLSLVITTFGIKRIILHGGLPKEVQKSLEFNLKVLQEKEWNFDIYYADNAKPII